MPKTFDTLMSRTLVPFAADPKEKVEEADGAAANVLEVAAGEEPNENPEAVAEEEEADFSL